MTSELGLLSFGVGIKSALSSYLSIYSKFAGIKASFSPAFSFASSASPDSSAQTYPSDCYILLLDDDFFDCVSELAYLSLEDCSVLIAVVAFSLTWRSSGKAVLEVSNGL